MDYSSVCDTYRIREERSILFIGAIRLNSILERLPEIPFLKGNIVHTYDISKSQNTSMELESTYYK